MTTTFTARSFAADTPQLELCRAADDPDLFFAEHQHDPRTERAKRICRRCELREPCLIWAVQQGPSLDGVWAATTARDRHRLRRDRKRRQLLDARRL